MLPLYVGYVLSSRVFVRPGEGLKESGQSVLWPRVKLGNSRTSHQYPDVLISRLRGC
jgi:hypothetical protein